MKTDACQQASDDTVDGLFHEVPRQERDAVQSDTTDSRDGCIGDEGIWIEESGGATVERMATVALES